MKSKVSVVTGTIEAGSTLWDLETIDVRFSGPPLWVSDGVKFFRAVAEVIGVAVAGRKVIVEFIAGRAHKGKRGES